jgi:hypothetical protein
MYLQVSFFLRREPNLPYCYFAKKDIDPCKHTKQRPILKRFVSFTVNLTHNRTKFTSYKTSRGSHFNTIEHCTKIKHITAKVPSRLFHSELPSCPNDSDAIQQKRIKTMSQLFLA